MLPHAVPVLRSGGIFLSFVPTVPQVVQTVEALERAGIFGHIQTFESLLRTWNIQGRSVRPDHRMVAHSGFITVARKVAVPFFEHIRKQDSREGVEGKEESEEAERTEPPEGS